MIQLKIITMKNNELLFISKNGNTIYFLNGYSSSKERLNDIYIKNKKNLISIKECVKDEETYIKKLENKKYLYTEYCDDYRQWKRETEYNNTITNIINAIRNL